MRQVRTNNETWISANWLSQQLNINRGSIHYYAVKLRLRYLKFNGARHIEKQDAKCLVKRIAYQYQLDNNAVQDVMTNIENYC